MTRADDPRAGITIARTRPTAPAARGLIAALDAYLAELYPPEVNILPAPEAMEAAGCRFFLASDQGRPAGCVSYCFPGEEAATAEVKRFYVAPEARGKGVGRALLAHLEADAAARGVTLLRAETGRAQPAAIALFGGMGYAQRGAFAPHQANPHSVFFQKRIRAEEAREQAGAEPRTGGDPPAVC